MELVNATTAGLDSVMWRSRTHYASLLNQIDATEREEPIPLEEWCVTSERKPRPWPPVL
jgi:hypothetical protein